jgi:hypothetical protein
MSTNLFPADDGVCIVDYEIQVDSEYHTKGSPVYAIANKTVGPMNVPAGVGVGHRLTPGGITGAGAGFTGKITMKYVSQVDWMNAFLKKYKQPV